MMRLCLLRGMQVSGAERRGRRLAVCFEKGFGDAVLWRPVRRAFSFSIEGWPIKRACEVEGVYGEVFGEVLEDGHPSLDELIMLDAAYENVLHVAVVEGKPVGFKHAQERTRGMLHSHIGGVRPDYRGGGVAGALMRAQHAWAASQGYAAVTTRSRNRYPQMLRLNLKHGFEIVGVTEAMGELAIQLFKRLK